MFYLSGVILSKYAWDSDCKWNELINVNICWNKADIFPRLLISYPAKGCKWWVALSYQMWLVEAQTITKIAFRYAVGVCNLLKIVP